MSEQRKESSVGRRRLRALLAAVGGTGTAAAMALVLYFYGLPYNPVWWLVMALILAGAGIVPALLAPAVEWVMDGYRQDQQQR